MKNLIAFLIIISMSSCSTYIPFTQEIRNEFENKNVDITKVQFAIQSKIVLQRSTSKENQNLNDGTVKTTKELIREKIIFSAGTPAICKDTKQDKLALYFENGDLISKRLIFKLNPQNNYVFFQNSGIVEYDNQNYQVSDGQGTILYVSKKEITKTKDLSRNVKGLKVN